ncbi:hypothetical protein D2T31_21270 [Sinirhodobacter populi]|uniref:Uncharacterized protein n=1 Tax=Paenirhodobacter populi TaxID=2306993 RepID=A0A443JZV4_9RHOB|nr:hypothetical protein D2T31_21270 [Sinirhodobacter populi]
MTISNELLDELLKGCKRPEDLLGPVIPEGQPERPHQGRETVNEEAQILEQAEHPEAEDKRQRHPAFARAGFLCLFDPECQHPDHDRRQDQQAEEPPVPEPVEQPACKQQDCGARLCPEQTQCQDRSSENRQEEAPEGKLGDKHDTSGCVGRNPRRADY